jgi:osmoprotectant transport system permease protein
MIDFILHSYGEILERTVEHLYLTAIAVGAAVIIGIPVGIVLTRNAYVSGPVLGAASVIQTIPSLALLGLMIPLFGIGAGAGIFALFLYALLPILRNTYTGICGVDKVVLEAGRGMGMTERQLLFKVQLPLAVPVIMAGVRTSTVINVGVATLVGLIGAGGLGVLIFQGISMVRTDLILAGAIPAALLALLLDFILGKAERMLSPGKKGERS